MESPKKILVVEDEPHISRLVSMHLADLGYEIKEVATAAEGLVQARRSQFDLIILDLMLPDQDGLEVCHSLRASRDFTPILILTARSAEPDRVLGLDLGADDYLTKPFSIRELVARVRAILRRVEILEDEKNEAVDSFAVGDIALDTSRRKVTVAGRPVSLTAKEFDLLLQFARHPGHVYTRAQLLDQVWGYSAGCYEHTVNSHINRLRAKIEAEPGDPRYIQTVWGVGYRFFDPAEDSAT
jgi:DNA-binding response OmpR family regulator